MRKGMFLMLGSVGGAVTMDALGVPLLGPRQPAAQVPSAVAAVQEWLASAQRLYWVMDIPTGKGPNGNFGPTQPIALRYDLDAGKLSLDGHGFRYVYADGIATVHNHILQHEREPVRLPLAEPILAGLLEELDHGLANSNWIREDPPYVRSGLGPSTTFDWYRVDLPFAWDNPYRIYLQVSTLTPGGINALAVLRADVDHMLLVQHVGKLHGAFFEVLTHFHWIHLNPDFTQSQYGFPADPFADRKYQELSVRRYEYMADPPYDPQE
jgi:hypothetical protein